MILVSACLAGFRCRYNGKSAPDEEVLHLLRQGKALPLCPESLGGLPIPRPCAEIAGGDGKDVLIGRSRVLTRDKSDLTAAFLRGAQETLQCCCMAGIQRAILKQGSPSCGQGIIYDGTFTGQTREGNGVLTALLLENGIHVDAR